MGLTFDPPAPMYTQPEADVTHFISETDLALIKAGAHNRLYDLSLALGGAAFGFIQNVVGLFNTLSDGRPPAKWDVFSAMLCAALAAASICLFFSNKSKENPLKAMVAKIERRERKPFIPAEATPATAPNSEPAPKVAEMREQGIQ